MEADYYSTSIYKLLSFKLFLRYQRELLTSFNKTTIDERIIEGAKTVKKEVMKHIITAITADLIVTIADVVDIVIFSKFEEKPVEINKKD